jgi:hypothetical protein
MSVASVTFRESALVRKPRSVAAAVSLSLCCAFVSAAQTPKTNRTVATSTRANQTVEGRARVSAGAAQSPFNSINGQSASPASRETSAPVLVLPTYAEPKRSPVDAAPPAGPSAALPDGVTQLEVFAPQSESVQASAAPTQVPTGAKDLEHLFLEKAQAAVVKQDCLSLVIGLEDIAADEQKSVKTESARLLLARCYVASMKPRQAVREFRKYLAEYPQGAYVAEAKTALGQ